MRLLVTAAAGAVLVLAVPAAAQNYLLTLEGTAFAPTSANPIAEVTAFGGQTVRAAFQINTNLASFTPVSPAGGVGQAGLWTGSVQNSVVTLGSTATLFSTGNNPGNIFLVDNGAGNPAIPNSRIDQVTISASTGITSSGPLRTYDIFGLSPDIYLQSLAFGRTAPGTTSNLPQMVTDVTQRPDFLAYLFGPVGNPPFLSMVFRQGNPTSFPVPSTIPSQTLSVGNLRFEVLNLDTPGIPEPSSWAMLIAGFGLVGAAARRRRVVAAA